jgi:hypothetical protein
VTDFSAIGGKDASELSLNDFVSCGRSGQAEFKTTIRNLQSVLATAFTPKQLIATTSNVNVTGKTVICTGSTTAPQLPAPQDGMEIKIKNMGSGNCVITGTGSAPIVPLNSVSTGATTLTLATDTQAILVSDGTNWYRLA